MIMSKKVNIILAMVLSSALCWGLTDKTSFKYPGREPLGVYWYWISGNVTPEGIRADIESMSRAGINHAFIGFQSLEKQEAPRGPVYVKTPEWYECINVAAEAAKKHDITLGLFNCPGWSQSGGPWISKRQSQRYLGSVKIKVTDKKKKIVLPHPQEMLSDVAVLAWRLNNYRRFEIDGAELSGVVGERSVSMSTQHMEVRSIIVNPSWVVDGEVKVSTFSGGEWHEKRDFKIKRTLMLIEVGYDVVAPIACSLDGEKCDSIRLFFNFTKPSAIKSVEVSERPVVDDYAEKMLSRMYQGTAPLWKEYKWKERRGDAEVKSEEILDITQFLRGDTLRWEPPTGEWIISRLYMAPTNIPNSPAWGDGQGIEMDKWDPDVARHHYQSFVGDILSHISEENRGCIKYVVADSYERATQTYGDDFREFFMDRYGYDPVPWLPVLSGTVVDSPEESDRFLWDFRRLIADRLADDYVTNLRKLANGDGMKLWLEPYGHGGFPGEFLKYGSRSDDVAGEFWSEGSLGDIENRAASSVAHTYGKKRCWAESFTSSGNEFSRSPRTMKKRIDRFFTEGINTVLYHFMSSQDTTAIYPGLNCPFGAEFNRKNTWFRQLHYFSDYLKRCSMLLSDGRYVADVAYFIGDDTPVMTGPSADNLPQGYQYDYINSEVICNDMRVDENNGLALSHGAKYRLLVLPPLSTMRPEVLVRIRELVKDGAIILGSKPEKSPSLHNQPAADDSVRSIGNELWGETSCRRQIRKVGKGMVIEGYEVNEVLDLIGVKQDFRVVSDDPNLLFAHIENGDRDVYFISNQGDGFSKGSLVFRDMAEKECSLWNAVSGEVRGVACSSSGQDAILDLSMHTEESMFIVFEKRSGEKFYEDRILKTFPVKKDWTISLKPMGESERRISLSGFGSLTDTEDDDIKYFAGDIIYRNSINIGKKKRGNKYCINLGDVREMAEVRVNGKLAGGVWTDFSELDITDYVIPNDNEIEITVSTNWYNRIIGDLRNSDVTPHAKYTYHTLSPNDELQPTGLLKEPKLVLKRKSR